MSKELLWGIRVWILEKKIAWHSQIVLKSLRNSSEATLATIWVSRLLSYQRVLHCKKFFLMWGRSCPILSLLFYAIPCLAFGCLPLNW